MGTGLENTSDEVIIKLISNLKTGILNVAKMGDDAYKSRGPKECPPMAAVEVNLSIIGCFEPECDKRGINIDDIEPDISGIAIKFIQL
ncbi:hypothetical protein SEA_FRANCOB_227 [Streptomyces phage Francob]